MIVPPNELVASRQEIATLLRTVADGIEAGKVIGIGMATVRADGGTTRDFAWLPVGVRDGHDFVGAVTLLWHAVLRWGYQADEASYEGRAVIGALQ